jgi:biotin carboxyl carrier protein
MKRDKKLEKYKDKKNKKEEKKKKTRFKSLQLHGIKYKTHLTKKFETRIKWESPDPNKIMSFIPGTVKKVLIKDGQDVKEGQPMLVLMAMKMDNIINVPYDGQIKTVHVKEGDKIPKGFIMLEYA